MVMDMKNEGSEMQNQDGIHRQVGMLGQRSKRLDECFALRSPGEKWKDDRVQT
jgi:hypothetical protein